MSTFLHQPLVPADELLHALRTRFRHATLKRATTAAGVEVIGVSVARGRMHGVWDEWRRRHPETGWWPYASWESPDDLARGSLHHKFDADALEDLMAEVVCQDHDARAASVVVSSFRWSMDCAGGDVEDQEGWRDDYDPDRLAPLLGPALAEPLPGVSRWASDDQDVWSSGPRWLNFVPARGGYEVPVVLPYLIGTGNWYGYGDRLLALADDAALLRRWHEQWGAELFLAQGAHMELVVDRPPLDPRAAAQAATELFGYCSDTVQDPQRVGDGMVRSTMWSLWWD
ncbi:DUF4253 domain-containing protein [Streptomyces sp. NPDC056222]|uniref:DUF4253 domain-containing protein n=1 Tax=Streptomyces sp. NPDC056222 TaxID=3345749 RepID=UPI0035E2B9E8